MKKKYRRIIKHSCRGFSHDHSCDYRCAQTFRSRWFNRRLGLVLLIAIASSAPTYARTVTLRWAHVYEASTPYHACAENASKRLFDETNGRYKIDVFAASSLGREVDIDELVEIGAIDIIYTGVAFAGRRHPPLSIMGAPYMFRDFNHWRVTRDSSLFAEMAAEYETATGAKVAAVTYYGQRHLTSNVPINDPSSMRGLKIRVPNAPLYLMFPKAFQANPTPIAFSEVYLALQQGVVDAQENPLPTIFAKKFHEVQSYITLTGHTIESLLTTVSVRTLNRLSKIDRDTLVNVLADTAESCTQEVLRQEKELVAWFKNEGVIVNDIDRSAFREAIVPYHTQNNVDWSYEHYSRLQAIR